MNKITEIKKPKFDNRKFNGGQLDNGIKFSIVNDLHLKFYGNLLNSFRFKSSLR
jgi:hypothetical protein